MSTSLFSLSGRVALVTGSSRGLGRSMAEGIARAGAHVIVNGTDPTRPAGCPMVAVDSAELFGLRWRNRDWLLRDADGLLRLDHAAAGRIATDLIESAIGDRQSPDRAIG